MNNSKSLEIAKQFLNKKVKFIIDRPLGAKHPKHDFVYEVNYGFVEGVKAPDGEDLDVYFLGVDEAVNSGEGECIAIAHREDDDDDKLIVVPSGMDFSDEEIMKKIEFQEK